jgi:hypothetical protein
VNNLGVTTINGSAYPPVVPADTLSAVLTAGNTATNKIVLNNAGTQVITIDPSLNTIVVTDGTTTNTINKSGYTTRNTTANATHYINFSDSSSTGTGAIQKTAGISLNPSTNTITASNFTYNTLTSVETLSASGAISNNYTNTIISAPGDYTLPNGSYIGQVKNIISKINIAS